jgi:hypothetical protein
MKLVKILWEKTWPVISIGAGVTRKRYKVFLNVVLGTAERGTLSVAV